MKDTHMKDSEFINKVYEVLYGGESRDDQKCDETGEDLDITLDMALSMIQSQTNATDAIIGITDEDSNFMWWNREEAEKKISYYRKLDKVFLELKDKLDSATEDLGLVKTTLESISITNIEEE